MSRSDTPRRHDNFEPSAGAPDANASAESSSSASESAGEAAFDLRWSRVRDLLHDAFAHELRGATNGLSLDVDLLTSKLGSAGPIAAADAERARRLITRIRDGLQRHSTEVELFLADHAPSERYGDANAALNDVLRRVGRLLRRPLRACQCSWTFDEHPEDPTCRLAGGGPAALRLSLAELALELAHRSPDTQITLFDPRIDEDAHTVTWKLTITPWPPAGELLPRLLPALPEGALLHVDSAPTPSWRLTWPLASEPSS